MKDSKALLIRDTLSFLRNEGLLSTSKPKPALPASKRSIQKKVEPPPPKPPTQVAAAPKPKEESRPIEKTRPKSAPSPLLNEAISKHLPHIKLIEDIPQMKRALILCDDEGELPFLEKLKGAIDERLCPCTLTLETDPDLTSYSWIITGKDRELPNQILIERSDVYRDNPEKKRTLWAQLCHTLSPKSS